jgi:hypothetical protein
MDSPSPSDSKRSNAARLAQELGSSSPWSESIMPQSYGSISLHPTPTNRQETGDINESTSQIEQDTDPPPVYTRNPQSNDLGPVYELPAEAMNHSVIASAVQPHSLPSADDDEQSQVVQHTNPDVETPLLARARSIQEHGACLRFTWPPSLSKRRRCCIVSTVIISSTIISMLLLIIIGFREFVSAFIEAEIAN